MGITPSKPLNSFVRAAKHLLLLVLLYFDSSSYCMDGLCTRARLSHIIPRWLALLMDERLLGAKSFRRARSTMTCATNSNRLRTSYISVVLEVQSGELALCNTSKGAAAHVGTLSEREQWTRSETSLPRTLAQLMLARSREVEIHNAFTHVLSAFTVCASHRIKVRRCAIFSRQQGTIAWPASTLQQHSHTGPLLWRTTRFHRHHHHSRSRLTLQAPLCEILSGLA